MAKKAVDIVLIPPHDIIEVVARLNNAAWQRGEAAIEIKPPYRLPHLSLLMGVLDDVNLPTVQEKLTEIARRTEPTVLISKTVVKSSFVIQKTSEVQRLHEEVVHNIDPLLTHHATRDMYDEPSDYTLYSDFPYWVENFVLNHSFENFWPHISLHTHPEYVPELPFECTSTRLALCHLGDHNTCRTILYETTLGAT